MRTLLILALGAAAGCSGSRAAGPSGGASRELAGAQSEGLQGASPSEAFRQKAPAPGPAPELSTPVFQKATLKNGLTVLVSERHDLPLVALGVAFSAGGSSDPQGRAGLAELTYEMLLEGTGARDALALDNAFADLGTSPGVSVSHDGAWVSTRVLSRNAEPALGLLAELVRQPRFAAPDFDRRKQEQLGELVQRQGDPRALAQDATSVALYGDRHPYGHPTVGTVKTVTGLTVKDVQAFYRRHAGPKAAALVVTGDVTLEQARAWAEKYLGRWSGTATPPPRPPELPASARQGLVVVPKAGVNQTVVVMGRPALQAGAPREFELELASTVFGGFFGSRLNMNLRESKGYSYGAYAYLDNRLGTGPLILGGSVRADATGPALTEIFKELDGLKTRPITPDELEAAREGIVRSLPGSFETVEGLGFAAARLFWLRQPMDRYQKMIAGLQGAKAAAVQSVAETYFDPRLLRLVLVGDPDVIRAQVEPLNLGAVSMPPAPGASP